MPVFNAFNRNPGKRLWNCLFSGDCFIVRGMANLCAAQKWTAGACTIKHFMAIIYGFSLQVLVFVFGKPFQPSLMFVGKARGLHFYRFQPYLQTLD